ncbi:uncharacterized protein [Aegilops tauschii subsp. strangulata]|uniref:uncharacterized protein n=1 Tax=Aegilops tauschii subsp. strangulata TaxID=200361 RepID=UPI003CC88298
MLRDNVDFDSLTTPFSTNEIDAVVNEMPPDRAPGLDGFNGAFLKACWPVIKDDFYRLCAEFHEAINDAMHNNNLHLPIPSGRNNQFPVIQYADDTIIVMPACRVQANCMKQILTDYADSVGLHINFHKSTLIPLNTPEETYKDIADIFGCACAQLPFMYLGLPLGTSKPTVLNLTHWICKAERRITAAMSLMSYAGKLALMNSLVTSLTI